MGYDFVGYDNVGYDFVGYEFSAHQKCLFTKLFLIILIEKIDYLWNYLVLLFTFKYTWTALVVCKRE